MYVLCAPPIREVSFLAAGHTARAQAIDAPYEWLRDHTPLRRPLTVYAHAWARLPVFDQIKDVELELADTADRTMVADDAAP